MSVDKVVYQSVPRKDDQDKTEDEQQQPATYQSVPLKCFGARHIQALLLSLSIAMGYIVRAHLSVAMVAMTASITSNNTNHSDSHFINGSNGNSSNIDNWCVYRTYHWNKATQEMIFFSFFVGYTGMMMPMGIMAQKFGGKKPIMLALFVNGVLSILTPWVPIFGGWIAICVCRLLQGMSQAALLPSIHGMLGKWVPLSERGRISSYVYTGAQNGTVLAFQISGYLSGSPSFGWPASFWFSGGVCLACFGLVAWLGAATPHEHRSISPEELAYIIDGGGTDRTLKKRKTPWKSILTSTAVWGIVVSHAGSVSGYLLVLTQIPTYMKQIHGLEIKSNGLYSSLPYIALSIMMPLFGCLSDIAVNKKYLTVTNVRRTANTIGMAVSAMFLVAFCYVTNTLVAVILLIISLGLHSGVFVGFHVNHIDLSPNFAGPIMALSNMVANLTSLLVPVTVSNIVKDDIVRVL